MQRKQVLVILRIYNNILSCWEKIYILRVVVCRPSCGQFYVKKCRKGTLKHASPRSTQNDTRTFDFIFSQNKIRTLLWSTFYLWFLYHFGDLSFYFGRTCQGRKKTAKWLILDLNNFILFCVKLFHIPS